MNLSQRVKKAPGNTSSRFLVDTAEVFHSEFSPENGGKGRRSFPIGKVTFQGRAVKLQGGIHFDVGRNFNYITSLTKSSYFKQA